MQTKTVLIRKEVIRESDKAIGLRVMRTDGVVLNTYNWFPKSLCTIKESGQWLNITLPIWLWNQKFGSSFDAFRG